MTTALTIIEDAHSEIGVKSEGESLTAAQSADALRSLNSMVAAWELEGIAIGAPTWALSDTITLPENHMDALKYNLAVRLAPRYERQVSSIVVQAAKDGYLALQAAYGDPNEMEVDTALLPRRRFLSGRTL